MVASETLAELGATHATLTSRSGKFKSYEGQGLQKRLNRLMKVCDGTTGSVVCYYLDR